MNQPKFSLTVLLLMLAFSPGDSSRERNDNLTDENFDDNAGGLSCSVQVGDTNGVNEPSPTVSRGRQVQVSPGIRAGTRRYHVNDGYFFHVQNARGGRIYLRCSMHSSNPPCTVRAFMHADYSNFRITSGFHNHGPDEYFERVMQLRANLIEACRVRPNVRVEILYHDVCRNVAREVSNRVSLVSIRPSMVRAQNEHRPNIPHTFQDLANVLANNADLGRTLDNEVDLYRGITGEDGHHSIVFMSTRVVHGLGRIRYLFCDGTFYARPSAPDSAQLYTIVTIRDNHVIPIAHILMESRTAIAYRDLFAFLRNLFPNLDPDFIMTDFEQAQQSMLQEAFPRARLSGCLWHFARAVCRNVRTHGLHALVRDDENARRIVRMCLAIPLAPPGRLQEALNSVVMESRRLVLFQHFTTLFDYIRNTWINGVGDAVLSVFGVRHRTNNVAECHHRNLNSRLVRRPNIWRFIEIVREGEDTAWRDLGRLDEGYVPSRARRVSSVFSDSRIRSCSRQVMHEEIDMLHFLACVSWRLQGTMEDFFHARPDEERPPSPQRGPPPNPQQEIGAVSRRSGSLCRQTGSPSEGMNNHQMDSDFQAQSSGFAPCDGTAMSMASQQQRGPNRNNFADDCELYESLMEDQHEDPDDPPPRASSRGRRAGRGRARGRGVGRGSRGNGRTGGTSSRAGSTSSRGAQRSRGGRSSRGRDMNVEDDLGASSQSHPHPPLARRTMHDGRSSPGNQIVNFRPENFSDEEILVEDNPQNRRWQECLICNQRVGRYTLLNCGAFPVCGSCISHWFLVLRNNRCPHCGGPSNGWLRLNYM